MLKKEVQKHPCEILVFLLLGDYFTSAVSLSGFKALCKVYYEYFCHKNRKESRARPIYSEQEMRKSDLRSHGSLTYSVDIQRYQFHSTMPRPVSRKPLLHIKSLNVSRPCLKSLFYLDIFTYVSNYSNATLPLQKKL